MLKIISKTLTSVALVALATTAMAGKGEPWITDMEQAQKVAKAEGKDIFVYFTGSDWCGWCIKLDEEVLSKEEFLNYAKDNLVLVDLDFPNSDDIITEEQREHNEEWQDVFEPRGFPSIYLTDASANPYAVTGYRDNGPVKYVEHLKALSAGQAAAAQLKADAAKASGVARAKLLDQMLNEEGAFIEDRDTIQTEIIALAKGKDDALYNKYYGIQAGKNMWKELADLRSTESNPEETLEKMLAIHKKYSFIKEGRNLHSLLGGIGDQFIKTKKSKEGIAFMDSIVTDDSYPLDVRQATALFKGIITVNVEQDNIAQANEYFDKAAAMDPNSAQGKRAIQIKESLSKEKPGA